MEDVHALPHWDSSGDKHCVRLFVPEGSVLLQVRKRKRGSIAIFFPSSRYSFALTDENKNRSSSTCRAALINASEPYKGNAEERPPGYCVNTRSIVASVSLFFYTNFSSTMTYGNEERPEPDVA